MINIKFETTKIIQFFIQCKFYLIILTKIFFHLNYKNLKSMSSRDLHDIDPKKYIIIKNSRVNNLKDISVVLPKNNFIVII